MKWFWRILIAGIILFLILFLSLDRIASGYVDENVRKFQKQLEGRYNFDYASIDVSVLQKKVVLEDFSLESVLDSLNPENKFDFHLDKLVLKFNTYREVVQKGQLHIVKVELRSPTIFYGLRKKLSKEDVDERSFEDEYDEPEDDLLVDSVSAGKAFVQSVRLEDIEFLDAKATIYHLDEPEKKLVNIDDLDLMLTEVFIDLQAANVDDMLSGEELVLEMKGISSDELPDHEVEVESLGFRYSTKELTIKGVKFKNREGAVEFASRHEYRTPWFDVKVNEIDIKANPWHLYNKGVIYLKHISIDGADVTIYNDVTLSLRDAKQYLPPGQLRAIEYPFKIDSILVKDSKLVYQHKDKAEKYGEFALYNLHVQASNFTNIDYLIEQNAKALINVQARLWNKGKLRTHIAIDQFSPMDYVYASGSLRNMDLKMSQQMLTPLYGVQIHSGQLDYLQYDLVMNDDIGRGKMRFDYKDLKVDIKKLEKEKNYDEQGNLKSSKFLNFLVNESIITSNDPESDYYIPNGVMIFDRTKNKPIFDLYWKSLQSGIMDIVISDALYQTEANYYKKEQKAAKQQQKEDNKKKKKKNKKNKQN